MEVIFILFLILSIIQIGYWIFFAYSIQNISRNAGEKTPPVSILVCFKNEVENLRKNLDSWTTQLDDGDELLLVDDFSSDGSAAFINDRIKEMQNVRLIACSKDRKGKKQAITDGVSAAKNAWILVTDADCKPGPNWKKSMNVKAQEGKDFVLGYGPFEEEQTYVNTFQRFECVLTALQYYSLASIGKPYMGVGRNMAYRKNVFTEDIFENEKIASGDDDILVSKKANATNTASCLDPESFVYSPAKDTWSTYIRQKTRHVQSSVEYRVSTKFILALFAMSAIGSTVLFFVALASSFWKIAIGVYVMKIMTIFITLSMAEQAFLERKLKWNIIFLEITLAFYYLLLGILSIFNKKVSWK